MPVECAILGSLNVAFLFLLLLPPDFVPDPDMVLLSECWLNSKSKYCNKCVSVIGLFIRNDQGPSALSAFVASVSRQRMTLLLNGAAHGVAGTWPS